MCDWKRFARKITGTPESSSTISMTNRAIFNNIICSHHRHACI